MKKIITATDGSPSADRAVAFAAQMAKLYGAELAILTAAGEIGDDARDYARAEHATLGDMLEAGNRAVIKQASRIAERQEAPRISTRSTVGDPAEFVLQVAKETGSDAIVVGKRGRGRLTGLVLGSVSQKVVSLAPCAVVVVP